MIYHQKGAFMAFATLPTFYCEGGPELINPNQLALIDQLVHEQAGRCAGNGGVECDNPLSDDASLDETNARLLCARCYQAAYGPKQGSIDAGDSEERRAA